MLTAHRVLGDVDIFDLAGKLTGGPDAQEFQDMFQDLVDRGRMKLIINLKDVQWITSTGIGVILKAYKIVQRAGGGLMLVNVGPKVEHVFNVTKLYPAFQIAADENEAVGILADGAGSA